MHFVRPIRALLALALVAAVAGGALADETIKAPAKDSPHYAIIEGLKLIKAGDFDDWIDTWCSEKELCFTDQAKDSLRRYNLPTLQRLAPDCLKEGDSIIVTRTDGDPAKDAEVSIYIQCKAEGMPRPFHLIKEDGWKFKRI